MSSTFSCLLALKMFSHIIFYLLEFPSFLVCRNADGGVTVVQVWQNKGSEYGFRIIYCEIVMNVTSSLNFYCLFDMAAPPGTG